MNESVGGISTEAFQCASVGATTGGEWSIPTQSSKTPVHGSLEWH